jgi:hypothetical protein
MRHLGFLPCAATIIKPQVVCNYLTADLISFMYLQKPCHRSSTGWLEGQC